jgi:CelD/BcsL family acetyltransferase involved in cellulose biosynthesis
MNVTILSARDLTPEHLAIWDAIQRADRNLESPFFRPEFCQALADVRPDIEVAVLETKGRVAGFFPFQRQRGNIGRPVGGPLSDYHGLVLQAGITVELKELFHHCKLDAWHFDHLIAAQSAFKEHHWLQTSSPYINTSNGFEAYQAGRRLAGSQVIAKTLQKKRKLEREIGPIRFENHNRDPRVLETLIRWKGEQYRRSVLYDMFAPDWSRTLFRNLLTTSNPALCGSMSVMYVEDQLAAIFYVLRSHHVAHAWCTAYRRDLARYSLGYQLLLEMIQSAEAQGIKHIDLGRGNERYKRSFMSGAIPLAEGSVDMRTATRAFRKLWHHAHRWVGESSLRRPLTLPWRCIKRELHRAAFR